MSSWITSEDSDPLWIEYVYVIGPKSLTVLESYNTGEKEIVVMQDGRTFEQSRYAHRLLNTIRYSDALVSI
jgi:hypothetical protein